MAKEDWEIIRALSEFLETPLPYDELFELRNRMAELAPYLVKYDHVEPHGFENLLVQYNKDKDVTIQNNTISDNIDVTILL